MSHIVTIHARVRDPAAIAAACRRLQLPEPVVGTAELFGTQVNGMLIQLPDWVYPAVADLATGEVKYDNYNGAWGNSQLLNAFLQAYAVELTKIEARKKGYATRESILADGSIQVQILTMEGS